MPQALSFFLPHPHPKLIAITPVENYIDGIIYLTTVPLASDYITCSVVNFIVHPMACLKGEINETRLKGLSLFNLKK